MKNRAHLIICIVVFCFCIFFINNHYPSTTYWHAQNYLAGVFSSCILCACLFIFLTGRPGYASFAVFNITWYLALILNRAYISSLQIEWDDSTLLYITIVPLACSVFLISFAQHPRQGIEIRNRSLIDDLSTKISLIGFSILSIEFVFFPVPVLQDNMSEARLEFGFIGGFHVAGESILRLGTILAIGSGIVHGFSKKNKIVCFMTFLMATLLVSRSLIMELIFIGCFIKFLCHRELKPSLVVKSFAFIAFAIIAFSSLGNIREGNDFDIKEYSESKLDSPALNWLFAYFAINFDNLATIIMTEDYRYNPSFTLGSILGIFGLKGEWYDESYAYIGKLNLGTGLRDYLMDYGPYWGIAVLSFYFFMASRIFKRSSWCVPGICAKALVIYGVAFFPMVNRFSGIPYLFSLLGCYCIDKIRHRNDPQILILRKNPVTSP